MQSCLTLSQVYSMHFSGLTPADLHRRSVLAVFLSHPPSCLYTGSGFFLIAYTFLFHLHLTFSMWRASEEKGTLPYSQLMLTLHLRMKPLCVNYSFVPVLIRLRGSDPQWVHGQSHTGLVGLWAHGPTHCVP